MVKIGINGFGRISRVIFRACTETEGLEVVAINDPVIEADYISYLIKFDTSHGKFKGTVTNTDKKVYVNGKCIKIFNFKQPKCIPWCKAEVQYVIEAAGIFTTLDKASEHLSSDGVERVIVTAPSNDIPMVIFGVNEHELAKDPKVISCTTSTLYCLAPLIKILQDNYGVVEGFVTSIHAMTPSLKPIDGLCIRGKHWRDHRSINHNIIPTNTSACKALGKVIPEVKDKLCGIAFRVPVANVSVLDVTVKLSTKTSLKDIIQKVRQATDIQNNNVIFLANNNEVSSDFIGEEHSCVLDIATCMGLNANFFKLVCWYENEYSYACRVIDTIHYFERKLLTPTVSARNLKVPVKFASEIKSVSNESTKLKKATTFPVFLKKMSHKQQRPPSGTNPMINDFEKLLEEEGDKSILAVSCPVDCREPTNIIKTHDRLQKLKDEFRKMVNKTEDLLKKSYNTRFKSHSVAPSVSGSIEGNNVNNLTKLDADGVTVDVHTQSSCELFRSAENKNCSEMNIQIKVDNPQVTLRAIGTHNILVEEEDTKTSKAEKESLCDIDRGLSTIFWNSSGKPYNILKENCENKSTVTINTGGLLENRSSLIETLFDESKEVLTDKFKPKSKYTQLPSVYNRCFIDPYIVPKYCDVLFGKYKNQIDVKQVDGGIEISFKVPKLLTNQYPTKEIRRRKKKSPRIKVSNIKKELVRNITQYAKNSNIIPRKRNCSPKAKKNKSKSYHNTAGAPQIHSSRTSLVSLPGISRSTSIELVEESDRVREHEIEVHDYENVLGNFMSIPKLHPAGYLTCQPCSPIIVVDIEENVTAVEQSNTVFLEDHNIFTTQKTNNPSSYDDEMESAIHANLQKSYNIDLFDKLETTSSTISFKSKGGKSQIISVSDLTNSIDDLHRLNKICKILELSDELSDKLFSPLNEMDQKTDEKKLTFKELCEKIKVDEFFETTFGKRII